jgi:hypothetical protein
VKVIAESFRHPSPTVRANATEALEALAGTRISRAVSSFFDTQLPPAEIIRVGESMWGIVQLSPPDVIRTISRSTDQPWLQMALADGLGQIAATLPNRPEADPSVVDLLTPHKRKASTPDLLALIGDDSASKRKSSKDKPDPLAAIANIKAPSTPSLSPAQTLFTYSEILTMLQAMTTDTDGSVRAAAYAAIRLAQGSKRLFEENREMLSAIEKILFLKEVSFFQNMSVEQLKILATVCEEQVFDEDQAIFKENDPGDALYVIVQGRVGIEREGDKKGGSVMRLATLDERAYFGEMTLFNGNPRSTRATALKNSLLLRVRREPLVALIRQYPDLSLELINVLSERLREANDQIVQLTKSKPRELHKLYDKLDG